MFVQICACLLISLLATAAGAQTTIEAEARKLIDKQQLQAALLLLDRADKEEPKNAGLLYLRGYTLYRLRALNQARAQLQQVVKLNPPALRSRYILGRIALLQGRPEEAITWLLEPAQGDPPIDDAPAQLGKAYLDAHRLTDAQSWTERALRSTPWDGSLHYRLARLYQQLGEHNKAAREFQSSLDLKIADGDAVQKLVASSRQIANGEFEAARQIRDAFLKQAQCDPDILVSLGSSFAAAGKPEDAMVLFEEAGRRDPASFQARFDLGLALLRMNRPADAIAPLQASVQIAPSGVEGNAALGLAYVLAGKFSDALPPLELVHASQPGNARTEGLLALTYLRTGAGAKAIPMVQTLLTKQGDEPKLYFLLIDCFNSVEDQAQALSIAEQAAARFPDLAKAHLAKGQQLARLGRYEEAGPSFLKASEQAPQEVEPLLGLAEVRNKSGAYAESLEVYRRSLDLDPKNMTAQVGAAKDMIALGRISEAKDVLQTAAADHARSPQVHLELSRVYARLGAREEAARETGIVQRLRSEPALADGSQ